jgi:hypothetical protein
MFASIAGTRGRLSGKILEQSRDEFTNVNSRDD